MTESEFTQKPNPDEMLPPALETQREALRAGQDELIEEANAAVLSILHQAGLIGTEGQIPDEMSPAQALSEALARQKVALHSGNQDAIGAANAALLEAHQRFLMDNYRTREE